MSNSNSQPSNVLIQFAFYHQRKMEWSALRRRKNQHEGVGISFLRAITKLPVPPLPTLDGHRIVLWFCEFLLHWCIGSFSCIWLICSFYEIMNLWMEEVWSDFHLGEFLVEKKKKRDQGSIHPILLMKMQIVRNTPTITIGWSDDAINVLIESRNNYEGGTMELSISIEAKL